MREISKYQHVSYSHVQIRVEGVHVGADRCALGHTHSVSLVMQCQHIKALDKLEANLTVASLSVPPTCISQARQGHMRHERSAAIFYAVAKFLFSARSRPPSGNNSHFSERIQIARPETPAQQIHEKRDLCVRRSNSRIQTLELGQFKTHFNRSRLARRCPSSYGDR